MGLILAFIKVINIYCVKLVIKVLKTTKPFQFIAFQFSDKLKF
jgi:hypothetical protein